MNQSGHVPADCIVGSTDVQYCSIDACAGELDDLLILRKFAAQQL